MSSDGHKYELLNTKTTYAIRMNNNDYLPLEMLGKIFLSEKSHFRLLYPKHLIHSWAPMHVCRTWGLAAITVPELWTKISIKGQLTTEMSVITKRSMQMWLQGSGQAGFDISFIGNGGDRTAQLHEGLAALYSESHRWHTLWVSDSMFQGIFFDFIPNLSSAKQLVELRLRYDYGTAVYDWNGKERVLLDLPSLQSIELEGLVLSSLPRFIAPNARELEIDQVTTDDIIQLFHDLPNIAELSFNNSRDSKQPSYSFPRLEAGTRLFPNLKELYVERHLTGMNGFIDLIDKLTVPDYFHYWFAGGDINLLYIMQ